MLEQTALKETSTGVFSNTQLAESALSKDETTVTLKLNDGTATGGKDTYVGTDLSLNNAQKYSVDVKNEVLSKDKTSVVEKHIDTVKTFNDTTKASLVSVAKSGTDLVLTFDEPVKSVGTLKIDDETVNVTPVYSDKVGVYTVTFPAALATARFATVGTHNVVAYDVKDEANNGNVENNTAVVSGSYTIAVDTQAPTVTQVKQVVGSSRAFDIVFSEPVTAFSATEVELEVKKGNHTFGTTTVTNADYYTVTPKDKNTYRVTFSNVTGTQNVNPLFGANENSATLNVSIKGFKDSAANVGVAYTGTVTLAKDLTAPAIKSGLENKIDGTSLVVKYDKAITAVGDKPDSVDVNKVRVTDKDGFSRTVSTAKVSGDQVSITLDGFGAQDYEDKGPFKVSIAAGAVQSSENVANVANEVTIQPQSSAVPVVAFAVGNAGVTIDSNPTNGVVGNKLKVNFDREMSASATDLANYSLDGKKLNTVTGASIAIDNANKVVTITLPEGFARVQNTQLLEISTNVKTKNGSAIVADVTTKAAYTKQVQFADNTQPVLEKAEYLVTDLTNQSTTTRVKLTFSENINTNAELDDLLFTVGGAKKTYASATVSANDKKVLIVTLNESLAVTNTTEVSVVGHATVNNAIQGIKDVAGNVAKAVKVNLNTKTLDVDAIGQAAANQQAVTAANNAISAVDLSNVTTIATAQAAVDAIPDATSKAKAQKDLNEKVGVVALPVPSSLSSLSPTQQAALANAKVTIEQKANVITVKGFGDVTATGEFNALFPAQQDKKYVAIKLERPTGSTGTSMRLWKSDRNSFVNFNGEIIAWVDTATSEGQSRIFEIDWTDKATTKDQATVYTIKFEN